MNTGQRVGGGINAKTAVERSEEIKGWYLDSAITLSKRKGISILEALDYGLKINLKYAKSRREKVVIELRYMALVALEKNTVNELK